MSRDGASLLPSAHARSMEDSLHNLQSYPPQYHQLHSYYGFEFRCNTSLTELEYLRLAPVSHLSNTLTTLAARV
ncbi:hypothetical protein NDU88_005666 [Pleurodeles waltl]|uniref:Uncharacterized protein n=1 Tax=Pleurodeles waltl TaxID=8319 RepID=A0AAV7WDC9_PLEWA|nr:hypothetical protein NDU88_005666 [Pleurodeles waltl]